MKCILFILLFGYLALFVASKIIFGTHTEKLPNGLYVTNEYNCKNFTFNNTKYKICNGFKIYRRF